MCCTAHLIESNTLSVPHISNFHYMVGKLWIECISHALFYGVDCAPAGITRQNVVPSMLCWVDAKGGYSRCSSVPRGRTNNIILPKNQLSAAWYTLTVCLLPLLAFISVFSFSLFLSRSPINVTKRCSRVHIISSIQSNEDVCGWCSLWLLCF